MPSLPVQFDREKLKEAVWLIASYCPSEELGNVKLHKILYFSDMMHYLSEGQPITGVEYLKQKFGPTARHLTSVLKELHEEAIIETKDIDYYGFYKKSYVPNIKYKPNRLSNSEISLIKDVADFVRGKTAREISELSHNEAWNTADMGEVIPYFTAVRLVPSEIADSDRVWALDTALKHAGERPF